MSLRAKARRVLESHEIQIKTRAVEEALMPFIEQVCTLRGWQPDTSAKNERTRNPRILISLVHKATNDFLAVGRKIANENPSIREEMLQACDQIQIVGNELNHAANRYAAANKSLSQKLKERTKMEEEAKQLLLEVTRLLVLADLLDISKMLSATERALVQLKVLEQTNTWDEFSKQMQTTTREISYVTELATLRQKDMKSQAAQQLLVAVQLKLNQYSRMLLSATKVFLDNPEIKSAEENRNFVMKGMEEVLRILGELAEGEELSIIQPHTKSQDHQSLAELPISIGTVHDEDESDRHPDTASESESELGPWYQSQAQAQILVDTNLATMFQNFETLLDMASRSGLTAEASQKLKQYFQKIADIGTQLAASKSTRNPQGLRAQLDLVKQKLDNLLRIAAASEEPQIPGGDSSVTGEESLPINTAVKEAIAVVEQEATLFRSEIRRAVHDHALDMLLEPCRPLTALVESAQHAHMTTTLAKGFETQSDKLEQAGQLVCSLTTCADNVRPVVMSISHLQSLRPQVLTAARTLNAMPNNSAARRNIQVFAEAYSEEVGRLMAGVDAIIPLHDVVTVTEAHVREDSRQLVDAVERHDLPWADCSAQLIHRRCEQLMHAISDDLGIQPSHYTQEQTEKLATQMKDLSETALSKFDSTMDAVRTKMNDHRQIYEHDMRTLENHLQDVNDCIHELRKSILRTMNPSDLGELELDELSGNISGSGSYPSVQEDWPLPVVMKSSYMQPGQAGVMEDAMSTSMFATTVDFSQPALHAVVEVVEEEGTDEEEEGSTDEEEGGEEEHGEETGSEDTVVDDEDWSNGEAKDEERISHPYQQRLCSLENIKSQSESPFSSLNRRLIKRTPSRNVVDESETAQAMMAQLPAKEQAKIAKVQEILQQETKKLETEVNKWDDTSNDIVLLAKEICWMVMDMSDFTRGVGPLKTTMDVINTSKDIARGGEHLINLARHIVDACRDTSCRKDLQAYLDRVKLCCHQIRITSAVKADLNTSVKETVDGASNLIMASKNLMTAIVLVVKTSYVASKEITRRGGTVPVQLVQWRMITPKKKALYASHPLEDGGKETVKETPPPAALFSPIRVLGEFQGRVRSNYGSESGGSRGSHES